MSVRPDVEDPFLARFREEAEAGRLSFQRCSDCGYLRWPPAATCPQCWSSRAEWTAVRQGGSVWSFAVYERAFDPAFEDAVPYVVALVDLDAGPRMIANVVGIDPGSVEVGMRVAAVFESASEGAAVVNFTSAG